MFIPVMNDCISQVYIEERDLHLDEVKNSSEVFMTSTTKRILPVVQVDDCVIGNGKPGSATILLINGSWNWNSLL